MNVFFLLFHISFRNIIKKSFDFLLLYFLKSWIMLFLQLQLNISQVWLYTWSFDHIKIRNAWAAWFVP